MKILLSVIHLLICVSYHAVVSDVLNTALGRINGTTVSHDSKTVKIYRGIPYAKPPVDSLRFAKPEPFGSWSGIHDGTQFPDSCVQIKNNSRVGKEDCLKLNIFVPESNDTLKAVMVYIHGGSFQEGDGPRHAHILASQGDVIVVTISYRLNIFGFLSTGSSEIIGNFGLWDQHMALHWVHENIEDYGGDKSRVTIFGSSAGGRSVGFQMFSPHNNASIFQRAITQSGSALSLTYINRDPMAITEQVAKSLGCSNNLLKCLRGKTVDELSQAASAISRPFPFFPVVDGDFLPFDLGHMLADYNERGIHAVENKTANFFQYDYISGWNSQDGLLYIQRLNELNLKRANRSLEYGISEDLLTEALMNWPFVNFAEMEGETRLAVEISKAFYRASPEPMISANRTKADQNVELYSKIAGEMVLMLPSLDAAMLHADGNAINTYVYVYDHRRTTPSSFYEGPDWLRTGADHSDEYPMVFGYPFGTDRFTEDDKNVSALLMKRWSAFAKTGQPEQSFMIWPKFDKAKQEYVHIKTSETKKSFPLRASTQLWGSLQTAYINADTWSSELFPQDTGNITGKYLLETMELTHEQAGHAINTLIAVAVLLVVLVLLLGGIIVKAKCSRRSRII